MAEVALHDDLPAEEVLVRGAQEPNQDQGTELLRGASENVEIPAEQLLRATLRQEQRESDQS